MDKIPAPGPVWIISSSFRLKPVNKILIGVTAYFWHEKLYKSSKRMYKGLTTEMGKIKASYVHPYHIIPLCMGLELLLLLYKVADSIQKYHFSMPESKRNQVWAHMKLAMPADKTSRDLVGCFVMMTFGQLWYPLKVTAYKITRFVQSSCLLMTKYNYLITLLSKVNRTRSLI